MNTCYSGGAAGADTLFGQCASTAGHIVIHYGFEGQRSKCPLKILNPKELNEGDAPLKEANKLLQRTYPTSSPYTDNLLKRDYWQIKDAKSIYAVTEMDDNGLPKGGTAWGVTMGLQKGIKNIFIFDQMLGDWLQYDSIYNGIVRWHKVPKPVQPSDAYAGIGTQKLNNDGKRVIQELYDQW